MFSDIILHSVSLEHINDRTKIRKYLSSTSGSLENWFITVLYVF